MSVYTGVLVPKGQIVMSGFYKNDFAMIKKEAESLGLIQINYAEDNNWTMGVFEKQV